MLAYAQLVENNILNYPTTRAKFPFGAKSEMAQLHLTKILYSNEYIKLAPCLQGQ